MSEVRYEGQRTANGAMVWRVAHGIRGGLDARHDLWSHSPTGFEWGYGGSCPAQLALALLSDVLHNDDLAVELHQAFKWDVVARLPHAAWMMTADQINGWLWQHDQARADSQPRSQEEEEGIDLAEGLEEYERRRKGAANA